MENEFKHYSNAALLYMLISASYKAISRRTPGALDDLNGLIDEMAARLQIPDDEIIHIA